MPQIGFIKSEKVTEKNIIVKDEFTNALCFGQTGSGKTSAFIIPNLQERIKKNHGILVYDFKGNLHLHVKALAKKKKKLHKVHEIGKPWGKNIDLLKDISSKALESMFDNISTRGEEFDYWQDSAKKLFINLYNLYKNFYFLGKYITKLRLYDENIRMLIEFIDIKYRPTLPNIYSSCKSAISMVKFFKEINDYIKIANEIIKNMDSSKYAKKLFKKIVMYHNTTVKYFTYLEEYHKLDTKGDNAGNNGVLQVLSNTLSQASQKEFLSKDEFDIVNALNRGEIVIANVQDLSDETITFLNRIIYDRLSIRTALGEKNPITIFIDEAHRVINANSMPEVDICRENYFEFIMATQDILQLENKLGQNKAQILLRNIVSTFTFKTIFDNLEKFEYRNLSNEKKGFTKPIYHDEKELFEVEYEYQKRHNIQDIVDLPRDERYIVLFFPQFCENNYVLVQYIDTDKKELVEYDIVENTKSKCELRKKY